MHTYLLALFLSLIPLLGFAKERLVLVSMAPYVQMVDELTAKEVELMLLVPPGFSAHTYEPTPKEILRATKASLWFTVGELFEPRVLQALRSENPKLVVADLRQGLSLINEHENCCHHHHHDEGADTHIWMSPKMMQTEVEHMAKSLKEVFPELSQTVDANESKLIEKLKKLDGDIHSMLDAHKGSTVYVSHPAYGYFCREYGLKQESIEFEGKDPTPKHLFNLIQEAKGDKISTIFIQKQYSTKAAELVAKEVGAKVILLDPYSENYFESMLHIAKSFQEATK